MRLFTDKRSYRTIIPMKWTVTPVAAAVNADVYFHVLNTHIQCKKPEIKSASADIRSFCGIKCTHSESPYLLDHGRFNCHLLTTMMR